MADYSADGTSGAIFKVNRRTGAQSLVSDNSISDSNLFQDPVSVIIVPPKCAGQYPTMYGTPGRDRLKGTRYPDVVEGLGGNDVIKGLGAKIVSAAARGGTP